jgi:hypothetical protein
MTSASLHRTGPLLVPCTAGEQVKWRQSINQSTKWEMMLRSKVNVCLPKSLKFVGVSAEV